VATGIVGETSQLEGEPMPTYPYVQGAGALTQTLDQLRKSFPTKVDAAYLQRFSIAPKNESYVLSVLRFLGLINEDGAKVEDKTHFFYEADNKFRAGLEAAMRQSYANLFNEMGDEALNADRGRLIGWFRGSDRTSDLVGQRQAMTFQALAAYAGHGEMPIIRSNGAKKSVASPTKPTKATAKKAAAPAQPVAEQSAGQGNSLHQASGSRETSDLGVTVRIEVNLPTEGDAETYDAIFASIRKHLMS